MVPFKKSVVREYLETILVAVILALFFRTFVVQAFKIPTGSMEPNLLVGDQLLVNKFVFAPAHSSAERAILPIRSVRRGDVVVFKFPVNPERDFIKRVVGLPGETVELKDTRVYVNGRPLDEPYAHYLVSRPGPAGAGDGGPEDVRNHYGPVPVPDGALFVMGDNRDNSEDSRYWGFMPIQNLKGRALMIYWSWDGSGGTLNPLRQTRWARLLRQIH
ncbi:MAG TPA: signal peptidase I [Vicinamibacterales bacterium]|nr:signal peptidase I [Vicinamibacterales bacterium]HOQ60032.1 signal peptidase I [Vicinamibacterales bacterium]HPW20225.1 signal peptidase I [Vicinamibacterales bacterium]